MVAMAEDNLNKKKSLISRLAGWRWAVQSLFAVVWLWPFARIHTMCSPVFHCYSCPLASFACPIGVLANSCALEQPLFLPIGVILIFAALFGAFMCGWVCPFGFLQDLCAKVPTPKLILPMWVGYCRYVVLVGLVLVAPYWLGEGSPWFFCRLCPAGALEGMAPHVVQQWAAGAEKIDWPSTAKAVILGVFVVAVFFVRRPWCTVFCPLGAIYGLANRVSFFVLRFDRAKCIDCKSCRSLCQYGGRADVRLASAACNRCMAGERCQAISLGTVLDRVDG
jgi:ferredoxin-type protein NapH